MRGNQMRHSAAKRGANDPGNSEYAANGQINCASSEVQDKTQKGGAADDQQRETDGLVGR